MWGINNIESETLQKIRKKLLKHRQQKRKHPNKDNKILTDWNGLMIAALAKMGWILSKTKYNKIAQNAVDFIMDKLYDSNGNLLHRYIEGEAGVSANLNDYSFLIWGLIELYQSTLKVDYLEAAINLNEQMLDKFWDEKRGGFYFASANKKDLIARNKKIYDGAKPSGNSIAFWNLTRLYHITGNSKYENKANNMIQAFFSKVNAAPTSFFLFLIGVDSLYKPSYNIVIVGEKNNNSTQTMVDILREQYLPNQIIILKSTKNNNKLTNLINYIDDYDQVKDKTTVYICKNFNCKLPTTEQEKVKEQLKK